MEESWELRMHVLCVALTNRSKGTHEEVAELFHLNNEASKELGWPLEYSKHCGSCVARVNKRIRSHWELTIKNKYEIDENNEENTI